MDRIQPLLTQAQALSDLEWAIASPSLVSDPLAVEAQAIDVDSVDAAHLVKFLGAHSSHRVGRYFEGLVAYWLTHVEGYDMVGHAVQLREGKRTVGEIDFLFRDHGGVLNHWEAAVKFFLHHPRVGESDYPGPNAADNFEHKAEKLFNQQLSISEAYYPEVQKRRAFMRGSIFYQRGGQVPTSIPHRLAPNHRRSFWLRNSDVWSSFLSQLASQAGFICPKPFWLSPPQSEVPRPPRDLEAKLVDHFSATDHPVMVCMVDGATGVETERFFVVSDRWPSRSVLA